MSLAKSCRAKSCLAGLSLLALSACTSAITALPGTPEYAAAQVSRGYDCGLRVDRQGVLARVAREDRQRFVSTSASLAVKSYKAPRRCEAAERLAVQRELALLTRR